MSPPRLNRTAPLPRALVCLGGALLLPLVAAVGAEGATEPPPTGKVLYQTACASCHGATGRGAPPSLRGFDDPLPDFTDSSFVSREPKWDWVGIAFEGGPSRGFSEMMPAFGGVLTIEELVAVVDYIKGFATDNEWPVGELNLPRALVTGKAFPEDEAVLTSQINTKAPGRIANKLVYEQRFGARNQWEIVVPFGWHEVPVTDGSGQATSWTSSMGDIAVSLKRAVYHDRDSIVSVAGELFLPTGDDERGFGRGTALFEPYIAYGQILPAGFFLQSVLGAELTFDKDKAQNEALFRNAIGWTGQSGQFGRSWSPMLEVLVGRDLVAGEDFIFDLVPQMQVTLSKRQHIMANVGVRVPLNKRDERDAQVLFYVLWDWFDGTLYEGW
jgi:mono/diheme cytochrome c family protein